MTLRQLASHQRFGNLARQIRGQQLRGRRRRHAELHARLQANGKLRTGFEPVDEGDAVAHPVRDADDLADMLAEFGEPRLDLRNDIVIAGHNLTDLMRQQAEIITAAAAVPPYQAASDHADQIAVDFRRRNSSRNLDIFQARQPRAPEQGLQNRAGDLDGVDAVTELRRASP
jgi:hypothetical protein